MNRWTLGVARGVGSTSLSPCPPHPPCGWEKCAHYDAKAVSVEKKKQPLSFSPLRFFHHLKVFTYSSLQVQQSFTCIELYTNPYIQGGKTAVTQQKWVRSEEFCQASIFNHMESSKALFSHCPTIQKTLFGLFVIQFTASRKGDKSY